MTKIYYTFENGCHRFRNHKKFDEKIDFGFYGERSEYTEAVKRFKKHYKIKKFELVSEQNI